MISFTGILVLLRSIFGRRVVRPKVPLTPPPPTRPVAWVSREQAKGKVFDVYLVAQPDYMTADDQYKSNGMAWAYIGNNEAIFKEYYWPRALHHNASGSTGVMLSHDVPRHFENLLQEGIYLHEVLGHAILGLGHDSPHPTMHTPENLSKVERDAFLALVPPEYPYIRVMPWVPGQDLDQDDLPVT